jgi:hypothetical protein
MAILTPAQLQASNASTYTTNGANLITGANARNFNVDFISSSITVSETGSMSVANATSASYAVSSSNAQTASFALNSVEAFPFTGSAIISGSLAVTGSLSTSQDILVNGLTVGRGGGNLITNVAIGAGALRSNISAANIAIGSGSLAFLSNSGTGNNTAIGTNVMPLLGSGSFANIGPIAQNTIIGGNSGQSMVSGSRNTGIGAFSFQGANNIERNTGLGRGVLSGAVSGSKYNSAFGHNVMFNFLSGSNNVVISGGSAAGEGFILGSKNNIIGPDALLPVTGSANTIIGYGLTQAQMGGVDSSGSVVISDGDGNIAFSKYGSTDSFTIPSNTKITGSLNVTGNLLLASGSNKTTGIVTLDGGSPGAVTVSNSLVSSSSMIFLTKQTNATTGSVAISAKSGGSFTITSTSNGDADQVAYMIVNPG